MSDPIDVDPDDVPGVPTMEGVGVGESTGAAGNADDQSTPEKPDAEREGDTASGGEADEPEE